MKYKSSIGLGALKSNNFHRQAWFKIPNVGGINPGIREIVRIMKIIGLHILFWIVVVLYFAWGFGLDTNPVRSILNAMYFLPGHIITVYCLLYFLVPKFLLNRRYALFFLGL